MDEIPFRGMFFEPSEGWGPAPNECDQTGLMNLDAYAENYYKSAMELVTRANDDRLLTSTFGHPIVFLYRQYIELALKDLVSLLRRLETHDSGYPQTHSLHSLWSEAKRLINQHYREDQMPDGIKHVDQCVNEFHNLDSQSDAFRYPHSKKGKVYDPPRFDLPHLRDGMREVERFLGTVRGDLFHKWQNSPY